MVAISRPSADSAENFGGQDPTAQPSVPEELPSEILVGAGPSQSFPVALGTFPLRRLLTAINFPVEGVGEEAYKALTRRVSTAFEEGIATAEERQIYEFFLHVQMQLAKSERAFEDSDPFSLSPMTPTTFARHWVKPAQNSQR